MDAPAAALSSELPEVLPAPVSDAVIDQTIAQLDQAWRDGATDTALQLGRIIVENLYEADLRAWRARGPKDSSFRVLAARLAEREERGPSPSLLARACGLWELDQRLGVSALKHLTASHGFAVLGLPHEQQARLLQQADRERWSTRQLIEQVQPLRLHDGRGRKPIPAVHKGVRRLTQALDLALSQPLPETLFQAEGDASEAQELLGLLDAQLQRLEALRAQVRERISGSGPAEG